MSASRPLFTHGCGMLLGIGLAWPLGAAPPVVPAGSGDRTQADAAASVNKCPSLAKLDQDTATLDTDVDALSARLETLSTRLKKIAELLAIPSDLAKDLKKVESAMEVTQKGARLAEGVPQFEANAKKVNEAITPALVQVKAARTQADAMATKIEPVRLATARIAEGSAAAALGLKAFSTEVLKPMPEATRSAQFCILHFDPPTRACIQGKVDDLATRLDSLSLEMDKVVKLLLTDFSITAPAFLPLLTFSGRLDVLAQLRKRVEVLEERLVEMAKGLKELEDLLDSNYTVKIPYLVGHYTVRIPMSHILKGSKAVEDAIKDAVSGAVWDAAKAFGLGKLVKELTEDATHDLDKLASKLHLNPDMALPGLDLLPEWIAPVEALAKVFPGDLKPPQFDLKAPDFGWPQVPADVDFRNLRLFALQLAPLGLKWDLPKLQLKTPDFGCK